ncbi:MAG: BrnT family toxin [Pyrinomonadaceae bacterium]
MAPLKFEWDDDNIDHVALHHVETDEAEAVFDNKPLILRTQGDKYLAIGQTNEGRYLAIVFVRKPGRTRVITARDLNDREKKRFKLRRK